MLYCIVLNYIILYYTILYYSILYYTILYCMVLRCVVSWCVVLWCVVLCCVLLCVVLWDCLSFFPKVTPGGSKSDPRNSKSDPRSSKSDPKSSKSDSTWHAITPHSKQLSLERLRSDRQYIENSNRNQLSKSLWIQQNSMQLRSRRFKDVAGWRHMQL